jgi:hypothetical protein
MRTGWRLPLVLLLLGIGGYVAMSRLTFAAPTTYVENNDCGFNPGDFTSGGQLRLSPTQAWQASFWGQQEYFSALSIGLIIAFIGFAVGKVRQIGASALSGAVAGGGLLALLTLCLSCLAPTLAAIGLGFIGNRHLGFPKWLMTLNTGLLTASGAVFPGRRGSCASPWPGAAGVLGTAPSPHAYGRYMPPIHLGRPGWQRLRNS